MSDYPTTPIIIEARNTPDYISSKKLVEKIEKPSGIGVIEWQTFATQILLEYQAFIFCCSTILFICVSCFSTYSIIVWRRAMPASRVAIKVIIDLM